MKMMTLFKKVTSCFVAALCLIALLFNVFNTGANIPWYPAILTIYISVILLLGALIWAISWHYKQRNSQKQFDVIYIIVRYLLAFNISVFGWAKLMEVQFRVPESISSLPMNQQSGEWLTWYYFGYSYSFTLILALIQIAGSTLLLFRKTVLFGAVILFALMSNIALINIFYRMNFGALFMSILIITGLSYIILLDYKRLLELFFKSDSNLPSSSRGIYIIKNTIWFSSIVLSLLFVLYLKAILKS